MLKDFPCLFPEIKDVQFLFFVIIKINLVVPVNPVGISRPAICLTTSFGLEPFGRALRVLNPCEKAELSSALRKSSNPLDFAKTIKYHSNKRKLSNLSTADFAQCIPTGSNFSSPCFPARAGRTGAQSFLRGKYQKPTVLILTAVYTLFTF